MTLHLLLLLPLLPPPSLAQQDAIELTNDVTQLSQDTIKLSPTPSLEYPDTSQPQPEDSDDKRFTLGEVLGVPLYPPEQADEYEYEYEYEYKYEDPEDERFTPGPVLGLPKHRPEQVEDPFMLLPAKRKYHEMLGSDLFMNIVTKFALYMILVSESRNERKGSRCLFIPTQMLHTTRKIAALRMTFFSFSFYLQLSAAMHCG